MQVVYCLIVNATRITYIKLGLFFVSGIAGLSLILLTGPENGNFGDAKDYLDAGQSLRLGNGYPRESSLPFFRPPGYPFVIAVVWSATGVENMLILKLFNLALHLLTGLLVYAVCKRQADEVAATFGSAFFLLNPLSIFPISQISNTTLTTFLFALFLYGAIKLSRVSAIWITVSTLLIVATRPEYLPIITLCLISLMFVWRRNGSRLISVLVALILLCASLFAWGKSNYQATGDFILLTDATYYHLWLGASKVMDNNYGLAGLGESGFRQTQEQILSIERQELLHVWGDSYQNASIGERQKFWRSAYLDAVESRGVSGYASLLLKKAITFWRPFLSPSHYDTLAVGVSFLIIGILTIALFSRLVWLTRKRLIPEFTVVSGISLTVLSFMHTLFNPDLRYRFPIFLVLGAVCLAGEIKRFLSSRGQVD